MSAPADIQRVTRAVVWNQALWTAGYSLTTGGFLTYFGYELGATAFLVSVLLIVPETAGIVGLVARWLIQHTGNRKRVWLTCSMAARFISLGIPLLAFPQLRPSGLDPLIAMIVCLAVSQAFQAIAYVAYISWLADLVPEARWGRFFAARNISKLSVLLVVPVAAGFLRDWWRTTVRQNDMADETALLAYVVVFSIGIVLLLASMLPLLRLPNVSTRAETIALPEWKIITASFANRSLRFLFLHNWWLAIANGLTQAAFFLYSVRVLGISLATYYVFFCLMQLVKMPVSWATGHICDRFGNKAPLFWGLVIAALALPFWMFATKERWWLLGGAYFFWGAFAAVNIAGRNLVLKLSSPGDNTAQLALFRLGGGLLAGLSGLAGGIWLDQLLKNEFHFNIGSQQFEAYHLLFLLSFIGRITAALWVLPIQERGAKSARYIAAVWLRSRRVR
jgi:Na+/melibiose symporter-like transporter